MVEIIENEQNLAKFVPKEQLLQNLVTELTYEGLDLES